MFQNLDPLLHSQLRLAIMALLMQVKEADFPYLKEKTKATSGNLSVAITKLSEGGYIAVQKTFRDNYPQTNCKITAKGIRAFEKYVTDLKEYIQPGK